ncbi:signaling lymphocytic activation molecule-like [Parambassis ranga]|uniref:Signaling lymphocytic activation molecule-like n=1 Tax=Parambassis ranga TaxID=210632 RepID=A0A6P7IIU9_9TELE|nr:signaling lymphocytic activation molecule-like [Parambassis ranga]
MVGGRRRCLCCFFTYSAALLLSIYLHDVEASSCPRTIHEKVGLTVQLSSCLPSEGVTTATWKYRTSTASGPAIDVTKVDQFKDRIGINPKDFSLSVRGLTLHDSGEFSFVSEVNNKQRERVTITLLVHEPVTEVQINTWIAYNDSCTVLLDCTVTSDSTVTYNWTVRSQTFTGSRLRYTLSPQEGDTSFTCTASNIISEKSATTTVTCRKVPLILVLGVAGGGCLLIAIIVGVVVCVCCFKKRHSDLCCTRHAQPETDHQYENQQPVYSSLLHGDESAYEMITRRSPEDAGRDGPSEEYSNIQSPSAQIS